MALLDIRPNCECCNKDLPPETNEATICTYECTFCRDCADDKLNGICPNCAGNLTQRPVRPLAGPAGGLAKHPASTKRVLNSNGCRENDSESATYRIKVLIPADRDFSKCINRVKPVLRRLFSANRIFSLSYLPTEARHGQQAKGAVLSQHQSPSVQ